MKANLLFFATGSFKIPIDYFKDKNFNIGRTSGTDRLPEGHTCFNQICLPKYSSKKIMKEKITMALLYGNQGFHIA